MKSISTWVVVFLVLLGLAYGVDHGEVKLGIPVFVWLALNLTVFLFLLARFVGRPLGAFLEARKEGIAGDLKQAEERLVEAETLKTEVLDRLSKVEAEVTEIHQRSENLGREEAERIKAEGQKEAERLLQRVTDEISQRESETREALAKETAELTARLAHDLLQKGMTDADRKRVMDRSVEALRPAGRED
ncbi:MAG: F0F1 ATP synthase subunit B [Acidobacteriota bacterium]